MGYPRRRLLQVAEGNLVILKKKDVPELCQAPGFFCPLTLIFDFGENGPIIEYETKQNLFNRSTIIHGRHYYRI